MAYSLKLNLSPFAITFAEFYGFLEFSGEFFDGSEYIEPDLSAKRLERAINEAPNEIIGEYTFVLSGFESGTDTPADIARKEARFALDLNRDLLEYVSEVFEAREEARLYERDRAPVKAIIEAASDAELREIKALLSSSNAVNRIKARINYNRD